MSTLPLLFRPVGRRELELVTEMQFRGFPPRLPHQPFFYPVSTEDYAIEIARDWNTKDEVSGFVGYVLGFEVEPTFLSRYPTHTVGSRHHQEHWIPAADLAAFNDHLVAPIALLGQYGQPFVKDLPRIADFRSVIVTGLPTSRELPLRLGTKGSRLPLRGEEGTVIESAPDDSVGWRYTVEKVADDGGLIWLVDFLATEIAEAS